MMSVEQPLALLSLLRVLMDMDWNLYLGRVPAYTIKQTKRLNVGSFIKRGNFVKFVGN